MKSLTIIFVIIISISCIAQTENIVISNNPSNLELKEIFLKCDKSEINIYDILSQIVDKSNNSVQGLNEYLFSEYKQEKDTTTYYWDTPDGVIAQTGNQENIKPNKLYAVIALDAIGTKG
jgi:hypothetical protein